jgi:hypothetical protein
MHIDIKKKMFRNVGELYRNKGGKNEYILSFPPGKMSIY